MNRLPEVRKFLKESGGYELYNDVQIEWIRGHNPDLFILDKTTNEQIEVVDLGNYKYDELHEYFANKFGKIGDESSAAMNEANSDDASSARTDSKMNDRIQMNAEIFEGISDAQINTSSMNASRAVQLVVFILVILFAIYVTAFNPSLLKRAAQICGCNALFGSKATV